MLARDGLPRHARLHAARRPSGSPPTASDDLLVAYPTADTRRAARARDRARRTAVIAERPAGVTVMVDSVEQLELIERAAAGDRSDALRCASASTSTPAG